MICTVCKGECQGTEACASGTVLRLPRTYRPVFLDGPYPLRGGRWRRWRLPLLAVCGFLLLTVLLAISFLFLYH